MSRTDVPANARSRRTRLALLGAARAVLEEHGFDALTMVAVAELAGVSRRAVYLHYASRSELVADLFDHLAIAEGLEASLCKVRTASGVAALDEWARHEATVHVRLLRATRALELFGRADPDAAEWRRKVAHHQLTDCRMLAHKLADEQLLPSGWTVERTTDMLWALISSELLERLLIDRGWSPQDFATFYARLLRSTFASRLTSNCGKGTTR